MNCISGYFKISYEFLQEGDVLQFEVRNPLFNENCLLHFQDLAH